MWLLDRLIVMFHTRHTHQTTNIVDLQPVQLTLVAVAISCDTNVTATTSSLWFQEHLLQGFIRCLLHCLELLHAYEKVSCSQK